MGADLRGELARKITMTRADFDAFQLEIAAEEKACNFTPPPSLNLLNLLRTSSHNSSSSTKTLEMG